MRGPSSGVPANCQKTFHHTILSTCFRKRNTLCYHCHLKCYTILLHELECKLEETAYNTIFIGSDSSTSRLHWICAKFHLTSFNPEP